MSRIRTLKPQIVEDEKVAQLSDAAYRLFTSMIVLADDHGNVRADVRWLQSQIWWAKAEPPDVLKLLRELFRWQLITVYAVRGGTYAFLKGWQKHQRIDNAGKPRVPALTDPQAKTWDAAGQGFAESLRESPRESAKFGSDLDLDLEKDGECARARDPVATPRPQSSSQKPFRIRIPEDWQPDEIGTRRAMVLRLEVARETEKFRAHYKATGQRLVDWQSAFLKWLEKSSEFKTERKSSGDVRDIGDL